MMENVILHVYYHCHPGMSLAFVQALEEPEHYAQLLENLKNQVERVQKRRKEEKAHQKNIRTGKKRAGLK